MPQVFCKMTINITADFDFTPAIININICLLCPYFFEAQQLTIINRKHIDIFSFLNYEGKMNKNSCP